MKVKVADVADLGEGESKAFRIVKNGRFVGGFVVCFEDNYYGYENKCRHIPISLDYGDEQFFDEERRFLVCQTHGAVYEPKTGLCTDGPCRGASLYEIPLTVEKGAIFAESEEIPTQQD